MYALVRWGIVAVTCQVDCLEGTCGSSGIFEKWTHFRRKKRCSAEPCSKMANTLTEAILFETTGNGGIANCLVVCGVAMCFIVLFWIYANFRKWVNFRIFALFLSVLKKRSFSRFFLRLPEPYRSSSLTWISVCLSTTFCQGVREFSQHKLQFLSLFKGQAGVTKMT